MRKEDTTLRRAAQARAFQRLLGPANQKTVADRSGISESEISKYLSGERFAGEPKLVHLARGFMVPEVKVWEALARAELELAIETLQNEVGEPVKTRLGEERESLGSEQPDRLEEILRSLIVDSLREELPRLLARELGDRDASKKSER